MSTAYAAWAGKAIPTEAEWEYARRGGHDGWPYAWGEELAPKGKMLANYWQGEFPWQNLALDGYERTAPVGSFPPNGYGLFDMIGNAWEWTADWYATRHEAVSRLLRRASAIHARRTAEGSVDPTDPARPSRARCSKGAPGPVPRTTASAIARRRACPTPSTPAPTTSASAVSCEVRGNG